MTSSDLTGATSQAKQQADDVTQQDPPCIGFPGQRCDEEQC